MNFVKILHSYNRTHLYACGTGAFHPVCAFVEAGQHAEVSPRAQHCCGPQLPLPTRLLSLLPSRSQSSSWTPGVPRMARGRARMTPGMQPPPSSWVRESQAQCWGAARQGGARGSLVTFPSVSAR